MKFEWPTELAQRENGDFYERRLTVFEIVLRVMLDPLYFILSWLFRFVEFMVVAFLDWLGEILMAITRTMEFLERKYSTGKSKSEFQFLSDERADLLQRIANLLNEQRAKGKRICAIQINPRFMPATNAIDRLYSYPVKWAAANVAWDFAVEIELDEPLETVLITPVRTPKHQVIKR